MSYTHRYMITVDTQPSSHRHKLCGERSTGLRTLVHEYKRGISCIYIYIYIDVCKYIYIYIYMYAHVLHI